ncbi:MAG: hypothetical protein Q7T55_23630 [Solirubrobacteraceae bacterium]|nr:hypothetical protein [Solirubrobacteraceae bacterium]
MLALIRVVIPAVLCIAGIAVVIVKGVSEESLEIGIPVFSAGASVWLLNFLYRVGVAGDKDRDAESEARDYFAEHGRWPEKKQKTGVGPEGGR